MALDAYDVFVSYRSTTRVQARRIKSALEALAQPNKGEEPFRVFLDESSLLAGDLGDEIETGLKGSRALIVLIARDTVESKWVNREIEFWLDHGGVPDHLFLIRVDDVDLSWDENANDWVHPELVPSALRGLFRREQKYIDLVAVSKGTERTAVAPVFAALRGRTIESLLLDEAARARRRQRTVTVIAAAIAVLFVLAAGAGVWALVSRNQARSATLEALGQANAAQSILAGQTDPVQAAQFALQAAQNSDSLSVRAAMLSAAGRSAYLIHSFDLREGSTADNASFAPDGTVIGVVTTKSDDSQAKNLEVRNVDSAEVIASGDLPPMTAWVQLVSDTVGVLCSYRTGTHLVSFEAMSLTFTDLDAQPDAGPVPEGSDDMPSTYSDCRPPTLAADGLLVATINGNNPGQAQRLDLVRTSGYWVTLVTSDVSEWLSVEQVAGDGHHVLLIGDSGGHVLDTTTGTVTPVGGEAVPVSFAVTADDDRGEFFGKVDDHDWMFIRASGSGYTATTVHLDSTIWGAAPIFDEDRRFTGELLTLDHGSVLSLPGTGKEWTLGDDRSENSGAETQQWNQFLPTLRYLAGTRYLAVFGSSASVVDLDPSYPFSDGWERAAVGDSSSDSSRTDDWAVATVGDSLRGAPTQGAEPVEAACDSDVLLDAAPTGYEEPAFKNGGKLLVRADGTYRLLPDSTEFSNDCTVVETAPAVALLSTDASEDRVLLPSVSWNAQVIVGGQSRVAVLRGSTPVEVFRNSATSPAWSMEHHPNYTSVNPHTIGTNGSNMIRQTESGYEFVDADGTTTEIDFDNPSGWLSIAPDATGLVADDAGSTPMLVTSSGVADLSRCAAVGAEMSSQFAWLPADGYAQSATAARAATLVSMQSSFIDPEAADVIDCDTGMEWSGSSFGDQARQLTRYEVRDGGGVIETLDHPLDTGGSTVATRVTWVGDSAPAVQTFATSDSVSSLSWSPDGSSVVVTVGTTKTVFLQVDGVWQQRVALSYPGTVRFSPEGLVVITNLTSTMSGLWVVDPTTGYVVIADDLGEPGYLQDSGLPITSQEGSMIVPLWEKSDLAGSALMDALVTIPIGLETLREVLCDLNRIAICAGAPLPSATAAASSTAAQSATSTPTAVNSGSTSATGDALPAGWPAELAGEWCPKSDPMSCFSVSSLLAGFPDATVVSAEPSSEVAGATDYAICLELDLGDSCTTASSEYLRYFPASVAWDCTAIEVTSGGWPECYPDYTGAHDPSEPRLVVLPNHQQDTSYHDTEPMYGTTR